MASKCRKFTPNIFNKLKCQTCFGSKEQHSAEALESNKASRKVSKCGYLFVAPDYDFNNPLDKSRRWQRRFFVLYDDGELAYSVDENPDTVPQGVVDMNKCTDVKDASLSTSHSNSMAIITPEKTTYIKGNSKEEIQWWYSFLVKFPESNTAPTNVKWKCYEDEDEDDDVANKENIDTTNLDNSDPSSSTTANGTTADTGDLGRETKSRFEVEKVKPKDQAFSTYRGVRNMKHKTDKHYQEGLRKSSSLHDLSSEEKEMGNLESSRFLSRSGDRLNTNEETNMYSDSARLLSDYSNPYATLPRTRNWQAALTMKPLQPSNQQEQTTNAPSSPSISAQSTSSTDTLAAQRRGSFDDKTLPTTKSRNASERARLHRERSASMKTFPTQMSLPKIPSSVGSIGVDRLLGRSESTSSNQTASAHPNENETDEHKMAKSSEMQAASSRNTPPPPSPTKTSGVTSAGTKFEGVGKMHQSRLPKRDQDLMYMKKGWLIKMGTSEKDWKKHWFVLTGNSLRYYKDAKAEETNNLDGRIDLSTCYEISEVQIQRNYGFRIKTRNGEYVLSAMTSGIRSNWMKAIRVCMDLQSGAKTSSNSNLSTDSSSSSSSQRTIDDINIDSSASSRLLATTDSTRPTSRRETSKNVRRHYSDVNPGNISKMLSVRSLGSGDIPKISPSSGVSGTSNASVSLSSAKEPVIERNSRSEVRSSAPSQNDTSQIQAKHSGKATPGQEQFWAGSGLPFRRYVEGSDSHVVSIQTQESSTAQAKPGSSDKKREEEELKRRAKSPSAKIKDRSRAKSPKLHSPPPEQEEKFNFRMSIPGTEKAEEDKVSISSEDIDHINAGDIDHEYLGDHLDGGGDNLGSTMSSGEGMLVDLLETEVESLKEQLEHTKQELAKSHDSNHDLKTKLQSVVREKDNSSQLQASVDSSYSNQGALMQQSQSPENQSQAMKRQLKETKDTVQRQKMEIDSLKSKMDMTVSKLTGTEKALSEALKDVKSEKDKMLKITSEFNRKSRSLEGQLKETTQKMDTYRENLLLKEKENRKMDNEMKVHLQNLRDHEREILKLKAIEHEYRQMKEKFDETDRLVVRLRKEVNEKDIQCKKMESEYENHIDNIMQEVTKERDETEHHIEALKKELLDAQRKTNESDSITSNMADILREKDEIIAQLEEKMIENEGKMVDMTEELQAEVEENTELQHNLALAQEEKDAGVSKLKDLEKAMLQYESQISKLERESSSVRKQLDDLRKENTSLSEKLNSEKTDISSLIQDKESLLVQVKELDEERKELVDRLSEKPPVHSSSSDQTESTELLHSFVLASAEMNDVTECVLTMRKQFETLLSQYHGEKKDQLTSVAETLEDLGQKCESISEVLKEGPSGPVVSSESKQQLEDIAKLEKELASAKVKNTQSETEVKKLQQEVGEMKTKFNKLQTEDSALKDKVKLIDERFQSQVETLSARVEDMAAKQKVKPSKKVKKKKPKLDDSTDTLALSEEIENQLMELEDQIEVVEKVLQTQDLSGASDSQGDGTATEDEDDEETESESEDSDEDYLDSDETEGESDDDAQDESMDAPENILGKLKEMKSQLEKTNSRIRDLTVDINDQSVSGAEADVTAEGELRKTLIKCGEKIDNLTTRFSDGMKRAKTELPKFSDNTWAFQKCVNHLREKLTEVTVLALEHDEVNAKDLKVLQERLRSLLEYVQQVDKLGENDWEIAGKIAKQEMKFQHLLAHKENATKKSLLKYEDRLQLYADKLAFEAMILGQMGILIQRQQVGGVYRDPLLKEIHEANLQILELERRVDINSREINPSDQEKDLVSSYAGMLAEKIVLEGQLATCAMVQDVESSENMEVLSSLQVKESPTVLATEIFIRSQLDSSVNEQLQKFAESMDAFSNHIVTRALLQGEITHALQVVKRKFDTSCSAEDMPSLVKRERQFAYDQLSTRHKMILDVVNEHEPFMMTTLIQLIEYDHGANAPTLDSVCSTVTAIVVQEIENQKQLMQSADSNSRAKFEYIVSHLETELEDAVSIFREEYHCYVQTASPDIDPNILRFSASSISTDLAGILIQKAVIDGTFAFVSDLHMSSDVAVNLVMDPIQQDSEPLSELAKNLGQILLTEAANKQTLAAEVRYQSSDRDSSSKIASGITDLVGVIPDLEAYPQSFNAYAATLVREAMFQSQLTYTTYKLKMQYHRQLRDIKLKLEAGQKVELPSEVSREAQSDIQASLSIFEEILETKYQDECAVLSLLDSEISNFKSVALEKNCSRCKVFDSQLKKLEKSFQHEVSVAQERQNVHLDVLRQEVNNVVLRVDKFLEQHEKEKDSLVSDYEDRILALQDEFDMMRIDHEEELEQVRQDIMTAVSAIKANDEEADSGTSEQVRAQNKKLFEQIEHSKGLLLDLRQSLGSGDQGTELLRKVDTQLKELEKIELDPSLSQEIVLPVSSPETVPVFPPAVTPEPPPLHHSISTEAARSDENVDKLLEKSQHEHELELLKKEKDQALAEEIKTTKAALEAMRKAYEDDLEQEKEKYRYALKTMCTDDYVEEIRRRYDKQIERLEEELKQTSMHYDSKCEDYKLLEDRLQRTKADYQTHINQLSKSNDHLTESVSREIEQLKEFIQTRTTGTLTGNATLEEELYDAQIMVRVKDAELQKLRSQVKNAENNLERLTEEQRYTMTQYLTMMTKAQELETKLKEAESGKFIKDSLAFDDQNSKTARALRRTPSFHQRARSPSPETASPRRDSEHHSRDTHRRRQLGSKDLKRSKSSPSLPFVFEAKGVGSAGNQLPASQGAIVRRESSGKYSKSSRKS